MKTTLICPALMLLAASAAFAEPKDDVVAAAKKLSTGADYTWTSSMEGGRFSGTTDGKIQKDGLTSVTSSFGDNSMTAIFKAGKGAIKTEDGWKTFEEASQDDGGGGFNPARMMAQRYKTFKAPADEVSDLVGDTASLTSADGVISGALTEDGAKKLMTFGRRRGGNGGGNGNGPQIKNAKGTVKFYVKDGVLTKYVVNVSGTINRNDQDMDIDRTTTTEFKDVGTTTVTIPDDAKSKVSS